MAGRVLLAAVISAVLMMGWGFLYWGVFNAPSKFLDPVPLPIETSSEIKAMLPKSGMYVYPFPPKMSDAQGQVIFKTKHENGPLMRISYQLEGGPAMPATTMVKGFALDFFVALLAACLTAMASSSLPQCDKRFTFVLLLSLMATVWVNVGDVIWWFSTPGYCLGNIAYGMGAGLLMAIVIAALVSRPVAEPAVE